MKAQTRIGSLLEAAQNIAIGYGISVVATYTIGPYFHMNPGVGDVLGFGGVMTVISIVRSYGIRRWNEFRRTRHTPPDFVYVVEEIAAERMRQISGEGFSLAHDDQYQNGELERAAAWYALASITKYNDVGGIDKRALFSDSFYGWPWHRGWWKPHAARRDLLRAAALLVAAIGRLDRAAKRRAVK